MDHLSLVTLTLREGPCDCTLMALSQHPAFSSELMETRVRGYLLCLFSDTSRVLAEGFTLSIS